MFSTTEHEIFGILTFMSGKNRILGLSEPKKAKFLDIFSSPELKALGELIV